MSPMVIRSYQSAVVDGRLTLVNDVEPLATSTAGLPAVVVEEAVTAPRRWGKGARVQLAGSSRRVRARRGEVTSSSRVPVEGATSNHDLMVDWYYSDPESVEIDEGDKDDSIMEAAFRRHEQQLRADEDARRHSEVRGMREAARIGVEAQSSAVPRIFIDLYIRFPARTRIV